MGDLLRFAGYGRPSLAQRYWTHHRVNLHVSYNFASDQQAVWDLFTNPAKLARALPGLQDVQPIAENTWHALVSIQVSHFSGRYKLTTHIDEHHEPDHWQVTISGDGQGSHLDGNFRIGLDSCNDAAETIATMIGKVAIEGTLAQIDPALTIATLYLLSRRFFIAMANQLPQRSHYTLTD